VLFFNLFCCLPAHWKITYHEVSTTRREKQRKMDIPKLRKTCDLAPTLNELVPFFSNAYKLAESAMFESTLAILFTSVTGELQDIIFVTDIDDIENVRIIYVERVTNVTIFGAHDKYNKQLSKLHTHHAMHLQSRTDLWLLRTTILTNNTNQTNEPEPVYALLHVELRTRRYNNISSFVISKPLFVLFSFGGMLFYVTEYQTAHDPPEFRYDLICVKYEANTISVIELRKLFKLTDSTHVRMIKAIAHRLFMAITKDNKQSVVIFNLHALEFQNVIVPEGLQIDKLTDINNMSVALYELPITYFIDLNTFKVLQVETKVTNAVIHSAEVTRLQHNSFDRIVLIIKERDSISYRVMPIHQLAISPFADGYEQFTHRRSNNVFHTITGHENTYPLGAPVLYNGNLIYVTVKRTNTEVGTYKMIVVTPDRDPNTIPKIEYELDLNINHEQNGKVMFTVERDTCLVMFTASRNYVSVVNLPQRTIKRFSVAKEHFVLGITLHGNVRVWQNDNMIAEYSADTNYTQHSLSIINTHSPIDTALFTVAFNNVFYTKSQNAIHAVNVNKTVLFAHTMPHGINYVCIIDREFIAIYVKSVSLLIIRTLNGYTLSQITLVADRICTDALGNIATYHTVPGGAGEMIIRIYNLREYLQRKKVWWEMNEEKVLTYTQNPTNREEMVESPLAVVVVNQDYLDHMEQ
jgi:hypothetical protein